MLFRSINLSFQKAAAIDLAGRDVLDAVQTSVYPKVIDCPPRTSANPFLDAIAKDGIQLKVKARVTVRANLAQLIGGATEETIIARVGQGIVSAIGSADSHKVVLENPDLISKAVLASRLDDQTAFEIVSIDIADIDVGENIGARLQAARADFYNPFSQFIVKATQPVIGPLRRIIPSVGNIDLATVLFAYVLCVLKFVVLILIASNGSVSFSADFLFLGLLSLIKAAGGLLFWVLLIRAILSWVSQGRSPIEYVFHQLTEIGRAHV